MMKICRLRESHLTQTCEIECDPYLRYRRRSTIPPSWPAILLWMTNWVAGLIETNTGSRLVKSWTSRVTKCSALCYDRRIRKQYNNRRRRRGNQGTTDYLIARPSPSISCPTPQGEKERNLRHTQNATRGINTNQHTLGRGVNCTRELPGENDTTSSTGGLSSLLYRGGGPGILGGVRDLSCG